MRTSGNEQQAGRGRLGRRDADRLLDAAVGPAAPDGSDDSAGAGGSDLVRLLSAASGPALSEELSGEASARTAYSAAHRPSEAFTPKEKRVFSKALLTKAAAVKISAAVVGLSVAGLATAEAGALPSGWQKSAHTALGSVGVPAPKDAEKSADVDTAGKVGATLQVPDKDKDGSTATPTKPKPSGSQDADDQNKQDQDKRDGDGAFLLGADAGWLCHAVQNGDKDDHGAALNSAALQKLAKAAGVPTDQLAKLKTRIDAEQAKAQQQMQDFCTRLDAAMKAVKEGKIPPFPLPPVKPGPDWPSTWPTVWPSGLPTSLSSHWPTGVPTGIPSIPVPSLPGHLPTTLPSLPIPMPSDPIHVLPTGPGGVQH